MIHTASLIPLAPILLLQGKRVRANTPRLPEPQGERCGTVGQGALLNLLILGDSAAAGVGVNTQEQALSGQLTQRLKADFTVNWTLQAQTGLRVSDYLPPHDRLPNIAVDILVISLGVNDVTSSISVRQWCQQVNTLLDALDRKYRPRRILFTEVPPMHKFPALPQPLRWYLGKRAQQLNQQLAGILQRRKNTELVTIGYEENPDTIASDGFHPGAWGYNCWADALTLRIQSEYRQ